MKPRRLPTPVDPAAPPLRLLQASAFVFAVGGLLLVAGHRAAPYVFSAVWVGSFVASSSLLLAYFGVAKRRRRRYERRAGFLPRARRIALPLTGRTTLFRVEYGQRSGQLCLMLAKWRWTRWSGWQRARVVDHVWVPADDAVALGAERARLAALAEEIEDAADDARLRYASDEEVAAELLEDRRRAREADTRLARDLAHYPR